MTLTPGTRLGAYEIASSLGAGGMGEVYRARDAKLNRDVAIKVLPGLFALDRDRLLRFEREAQVLAALNHANIAHVYGVVDQPPALVMELVEGEDLAQLMARGPVPLAQALAIAAQIADALEAAHERGIVHRDLKPGNVKVREDGTVKVLDFGLAKAVTADPISDAAQAMESPTLTVRGTQAGVLLGTAAYMAPEQARGRAVDRRADIWAFGVVLYEMLAGRRAFTGDDISTTLASVLKEEVDWAALPPGLPPAVRRLLARCLEKDPRRRLSAMGDARLDIEEALAAPAAAASAPADSRRPLWLMILLPLAAAALAGALGWMLKPPPAAAPGVVARFQHVLPEDQAFTRTGRHVVAISPDGTTLAYVANEQLYLRRLDGLAAHPVRGSQQDPMDPVFSPDGAWIAYAAPEGDGFVLRKVPVAGGTPATLAELRSAPFGMSWRDGRIAVAQNTDTERGIYVVSDGGGAPTRLVALEKDEGRIGQPQLLDDGEHVLFAVVPPKAAWDQGTVAVQRLDGSARRVLVAGGADPRLLPTGHLIYHRDGTIFGVPVNRRLEVTGGPVSLVEAVADVGMSLAGQFDVSAAGTLLYRRGRGRQLQPMQLVWVDRAGRRQPLAARARQYAYPYVSPDGRRIMVGIEEAELDLWVWDEVRETLTRLTFGDARDEYALWMPGGREILFGSWPRGRSTRLVRKSADGARAATTIFEHAVFSAPQALSPDGRVAVIRTGPQGRYDLARLSLDGTPEVAPLLADPAYNELNAAISPDGRWLAYQSDESGVAEVYVRPFPNVEEGRSQVSNGGGRYPAWSRNGRELFFQAGGGDGRMMAVAVQPGPDFVSGRPDALFELAPFVWSDAPGRRYDVAPDGRFLMLLKVPSGDQFERNEIQIVVNWFAEIAARMRPQ